jgi:hypothetical protein
MLSDSNIREELGPIGDRPPDPAQKPRSLPVTMIATLVVLTLCLWGGSIALLLHFEKVAPALPDPRTGHVYRFNDQHRVVYLTAKQNYSAYSALAVSVLATLAAGVCATRKKPAPKETF